MSEHSLKIWTEYFDAVVSGQKTVELRNDDRGYEVGDTLLLKEFVPMAHLSSERSDGRWTGRYCRVFVTDITRGSAWLQPGIVALSILTQESIDRMKALERIAGLSSHWQTEENHLKRSSYLLALKLALAELEAMNND